MALVPYKTPDEDWLEWKRRADSWLWPTPATWDAYRAFLRNRGYTAPYYDGLYWTDLDTQERQVQINKDGFKVCLDVQQFKSYEISVRVENNSIIIEGRHDKRPNVRGYIERKFTRRYDLSNEFKIRDVTSDLSSDGILTVKAYPAYPAIGATVKYIPVHQTFRPSYLDN